MKSLLKFTPVLIIGLIWLLGLYGGWWEFIQDPTVRDQVFKPGPVQPGMIISQTKLVGWDEQKKTWEVEANRIWQTANGLQVYFEKISQGVIFSVKDQRVSFEAGWVRWEKPSSQMFIGGGMQAHLEQGFFTTTEAVMIYNKQELYCPKPVRYQESNLSISAKSMRVDLEKEELLLEGDVELVQNKDRVRAKGLIYNLKDEQYRLVEPGGITLKL